MFHNDDDVDVSDNNNYYPCDRCTVTEAIYERSEYYRLKYVELKTSTEREIAVLTEENEKLKSAGAADVCALKDEVAILKAQLQVAEERGIQAKKLLEENNVKVKGYIYQSCETKSRSETGKR